MRKLEWEVKTRDKKTRPLHESQPRSPMDDRVLTKSRPSTTDTSTGTHEQNQEEKQQL